MTVQPSARWQEIGHWTLCLASAAVYDLIMPSSCKILTSYTLASSPESSGVGNNGQGRDFAAFSKSAFQPTIFFVNRHTSATSRIPSNTASTSFVLKGTRCPSSNSYNLAVPSAQ